MRTDAFRISPHFLYRIFFGFHGAVGNDADHIVPHGGKTAVHHGVKHGLAVQQRVRRAVAQREHRRKMAAVKADLSAPVSGLIIADREVYAVAVNVNGLAVRRENNELKRCGGIVCFPVMPLSHPFSSPWRTRPQWNLP